MGVNILSSLTDSDLNGARGVFVKGDYAYVASSVVDKLTIVDISDSDNPYIKSSIYHSTLDNIQDIYVKDDYAYTINSSNPAEFAIIDVSDKDNPAYVSSISESNLNGGSKILVHNNHAFVSCGSLSGTTSGHFIIINIQDKNNPFKIGETTSTDLAGLFGIDFTSEGDIVTSSDYACNLSVFKTQEYYNDFLKGFINGGFSSPGGNYMAISGNYAYITYYSSTGVLRVINISDKTSPSVVGTLSSGLSSARGIAVSGNYAYVGGYKIFRVIDVSNPASPTSVGYLTNPYLCYGVDVVENYAYVCSATTGGNVVLYVIDVSTPSSPSIVSSFFYSGSTYGVGFDIKVVGDYAYLACATTNSVLIIDVSNKLAPSISGRVQDATYLSYANSIYVEGDYAYVGSTVVDISNKTSPSVVGYADLANFRSARGGSYKSGNHVYYIAGGDYLVKMDVSSPTNPVVVAYFYAKNTISSNLKPAIIVDSGYIIVDTTKFLIFDKSLFNTKAFDQVGTLTDYSNLSGAKGVAVDGDYAYVALYDLNGVAIVDISNLESPTVINVLNDNTKLLNAVDIKKIGDYLYITGYGNDYYVVVDVTDIGNPTIIDSVTSTDIDGAWGLFILETCAYVGSYTADSLTIFDISNYLPSTFTPKVMLI